MINDKTNEDDIIGVVEHNEWKFFVSDDDCIRYIVILHQLEKKDFLFIVKIIRIL